MNTFNAKYIRKSTNEDGKTEITLELNSYLDSQVISSMEKGSLYRLKWAEIKSKRSIQQNNLLWSLIHDISIERNSERATSDDDWDIYIEALERAQAKFEIIAIRPEAIPMLKESFRAVRELNRFTTEKGVEMAQCKVFYGSSKMDVKEMAKLLDTVIMMAQEQGVVLRSSYE